MVPLREQPERRRKRRVDRQMMERMDVDAAGNGVWAVGRTEKRIRARRDPAADLAQGIVFGALGSIALWALVGAVVISIF